MAGELGRRTLAAKRCSDAGERATRAESLLRVSRVGRSGADVRRRGLGLDDRLSALGLLVLDGDGLVVLSVLGRAALLDGRAAAVVVLGEELVAREARRVGLEVGVERADEVVLEQAVGAGEVSVGCARRGARAARPRAGSSLRDASAVGEQDQVALLLAAEPGSHGWLDVLGEW
jgi:hypothetical protein